MRENFVKKDNKNNKRKIFQHTLHSLRCCCFSVLMACKSSNKKDLPHKKERWRVRKSAPQVSTRKKTEIINGLS